MRGGPGSSPAYSMVTIAIVKRNQTDRLTFKYRNDNSYAYFKIKYYHLDFLPTFKSQTYKTIHTDCKEYILTINTIIVIVNPYSYMLTLFHLTL